MDFLFGKLKSWFQVDLNGNAKVEMEPERRFPYPAIQPFDVMYQR
jgi:hypothetical protein